jgi:hypothetical protein
MITARSVRPRRGAVGEAPVTVAGPRPIVRRLLEASGITSLFVVTNAGPANDTAQRADRSGLTAADRR